MNYLQPVNTFIQTMPNSYKSIFKSNMYKGQRCAQPYIYVRLVVISCGKQGKPCGQQWHEPTNHITSFTLIN